MTSPDDHEAFQTVAEVADYLGITPRRVMQLAERGELPCWWMGERPLFRSSEIRAYLETGYRLQETIEVRVFRREQPFDLPAPYQRSDGRWSVRIVCPDGVERRFVSRAREPVLPDHQRKRKPRSPLSPHLRYLVLERDSFTCRYCGRRPPDVALELDHVIPAAAGGLDTLDNLVAACVDCNLGKSDRSLGDSDVPPRAEP